MGASGPTFTDEQRGGVAARRADQDRTLRAMHQLEAALGSAAPGREHGWLTTVREALDVLDESTAAEQRNGDGPDSLLSDIARTQPWQRNRVRGIRAQFAAVRETIHSLQPDLAAATDDLVDYADVRRRLASLLAGLRHQRARESDLIYEAYYDAFNSDLEAEHLP